MTLRVWVGVFAVVAIWALSSASALAKDIEIQVTSAQVNLLRSADYEGKVIRVAKAGDKFVAVTDSGDFYLIKDSETGTFLYIPKHMVQVTGIPVPSGMLISGQMEMPERQDLSYWQVQSKKERSDAGISLNSKSRSGYRVAAHNGKKYPASYDYNTTHSVMADGRQLVRDAMEYLGTPYVLGGTTTRGIDCSGLTQVCLAKQGIKTVHRSSLQALEGRYIHYDDLRAGDLVFFRDDRDSRYLSHVGIYVGGGKFIHASQSMGKVAITSLTSKYFKEHYAFARRL
jgi:cell wall-associated NlpC family hydrolase